MEGMSAVVKRSISLPADIFEALEIQAAEEGRTVPDTVGPVDATVAETAVRRGCAVVTSDRSDIEVLGSAARRRLQIIDI